MGKRAREERRQIERARRSVGPAAEVADRAERGLASLVDGIVDVAAARGCKVRRVNIGGVARLREHYLASGHRWPSWCYLPVPLAGAALGEATAIDPNPALLSPAALMAALAGAWLPGRIAVRFDADLAADLMSTPLEGTIPVEVLHRLPAWGLYVDVPALGPGTGVFVTLDASRVHNPGLPVADYPDELVLAIVRDGSPVPRLMMSTVWLVPGASIADSLAQQDAQRSRISVGGFEVGDDVWKAEFGMSHQDVLARMLSLVLYLCSTDADTTQTAVPAQASLGRPSAQTGVTVVSAGFRIGAALRSGRVPEATESTGEATGRRVTPHLRRSHWHHYWCGSELRGDRRLELRWVPPVPVNADLTDEFLTVVRPARAERSAQPWAGRQRPAIREGSCP